MRVNISKRIAVERPAMRVRSDEVNKSSYSCR
jgi:hypothetical protein